MGNSDGQSLMDEELEIRTDAIEHQLAHSVRDPTGEPITEPSIVRSVKGRLNFIYFSRLNGAYC
jgi:hypothetical protein